MTTRESLLKSGCSGERPSWVPAMLSLWAAAFGGELSAEASGSARTWTVSPAYTADYWHSLEGGLEQGGAYLDQLDLIVAWDGAGVGIDGWHANAHLIYNNGGSISRLVGDTHVLSNIESDRAVRLLEAWVEYRAAGDLDRSIKLGIYDFNSEFDASEVGGALINSTFGMGVDVAQSGDAGPSIFPYTGLGLRGLWQLNDSWRVQAAVIDGVPIDAHHPRRVTSLALKPAEGALFAAEVERRGVAWRAVLGHWRYSATFDELDRVEGSGAPRGSRRNVGTYAFVEGTLAEFNGRALRGMMRIGSANPRLNVMGTTTQAALVFERPLLGREGEHLAVGLAQARIGKDARRAALTVGDELSKSESVVELSWRLPLAERLVIQPDVQYILNPGSLRDARDALVLGLRFEIDLASH